MLQIKETDVSKIKTVQVTRILNVFKPEESKSFCNVPVNLKIKDWFPNFNGIMELNGNKIENKEDVLEYKVQEKDKIVLIDMPGVASIVVGIIFTAISIGVSYLLQPKPPRLTSPGRREEETREPQFTTLQTTVGPGRVIPFILGGPIRVSGHIIEAFTDVKFDKLPKTQENAPNIPDKVTNAQLHVSDPGSERTLNTRIAWCWGPVERIDKLEIDDNPVENMKGIQFEHKLGTAVQGPPEGFGEGLTKNVRSLGSGSGLLVSKDTPPSDIDTLQEVDSVEIQLRFKGGLFRLTNSGKIRQRTVTVRFSFKEVGASVFTTVEDDLVISGAQRSEKNTFARIRFPRRAFYTVRVRRITDDNLDVQIQDEFHWMALTEVKPNDRAHPGVANTGIRHIAQEQTPAPRKYSVEILGANDVRVYSTNTMFSTVFSANPAWCFLRWLTHPYYGPGRDITYEDNIDIPSFREVALRCDEFINNGAGSVDHRCRFAFEFRRQFSVPDIIELFSNAMDAKIVDEGGTWRAIPNEDDSAVVLFTEGNIEVNSLETRFISTFDRASRIHGCFQNIDRDFETDCVTLVSPNAIVGNHYEEETINLWGITRKFQVLNILAQVLNFNSLSDKVIRFNTGMDQMSLKVGDFINFASRSSGIGIASGRLLRITVNLLTLTIDEELTFDPVKTYEITVMHRDGSFSTIQIDSLENNNVTVINAGWTVQPQIGDIYTIGEVTFSIEKYRIEKAITKNNLSRELTCILVKPDIFSTTIVTEDESIEATQLFNPFKFPDPVENLKVASRLSEDNNGDRKTVIDVGWTLLDRDQVLRGFDVWFRNEDDVGWNFAGFTAQQRFTIQEEIEPNETYEIIVNPISPIGNKRNLDEASPITIST